MKRPKAAKRRKHPSRAVPAKKPRRPKLPDLRGLTAEQMLRAMVESNAELIRVGVDHAGAALTQQQYRMLQNQNAELLVQIGDLTGDGLVMREEKIVRMPAFRRVAAEMLGALEPWPEAMAALGETLARLERGEAAQGVAT